MSLNASNHNLDDRFRISSTIIDRSIYVPLRSIKKLQQRNTYYLSLSPWSLFDKISWIFFRGIRFPSWYHLVPPKLLKINDKGWGTFVIAIGWMKKGKVATTAARKRQIDKKDRSYQRTNSWLGCQEFSTDGGVRSGVDASGARASVPPSFVLYRPAAGGSTNESHQRRPTGDVKTHCDISLCPAFLLGLHSPRTRLASLCFSRVSPVNSRHALFSLLFRVVEHPSSTTDCVVTAESMDSLLRLSRL